MIQTNPEQPEDLKPLLAPCRKVSASAPLVWLQRGFNDFMHATLPSLGYGLMMTGVSLFITIVAYQAHSIVLAIALTAGFFFMGPGIGIGLYSISRQLGRGKKPKMLRSLKAGKRNLGNAMVLSLMFLVVFLIWARAASMVHIFFPSLAMMTWQDWAMFWGVGTAIGAVFSAIIFCIGAFSIPMLIDRDVDPVTAVITSINAVLKNKLTMLVWGALIVVLITFGVFTLYLGFAVLLPVVGHATWHAYLDVIEADAWAVAPGLNDPNSD